MLAVIFVSDWTCFALFSPGNTGFMAHVDATKANDTVRVFFRTVLGTLEVCRLVYFVVSDWKHWLLGNKSYSAWQSKVHAHVHAIIPGGPGWWSRVHAHVHAVIPGGPGCMIMYRWSYLVVQGACSCTCHHTWQRYMLRVAVQGTCSCTCNHTWQRYMLMYMRSYLGPGCMLIYLQSYLAVQGACSCTCNHTWQRYMLMYMRSYLVVQQGACSCTCDHTLWSKVHANVQAIIPGGPWSMLMYRRSYLAKVHAHVHAIIPGGPGYMLTYLQTRADDTANFFMTACWTVKVCRLLCFEIWNWKQILLY